MIFEIKEKKDPELEEMFQKAMKELEVFFKLNWKRNVPKIVILKDREEIDGYKQKKTPEWLVGWAEGTTIYLLNRENYEKESFHKYTKKKYYRLLKHELCHLFFDIVSEKNSYNQFIWFNEGIAGYLSGQDKDKEIPKEFKKFLSQYSNWEGNAYGESTYAIKYLVKEFGNEKLLKMIKSLSKVNSEEGFKNNFKNIYERELNYELFNELLKK